VATVYYMNFGDRRNWAQEGCHEIQGLEHNFWEHWCKMYNEEDCLAIEDAYRDMYDEGHVYDRLMRGYVVELYEECTVLDLRDYRLGIDIRDTSYCADMPEEIIRIIMMFIDWEDRVKFGYLSDAVHREVKVVCINLGVVVMDMYGIGKCL
jgi:hypothetical protein